MRKSMLIALVTLSAGLAVPPSALAETAPAGSPELQLKSAKVNNAESQLKMAENALREAVSLAQTVSKMLDEARRDKDLMRANALNRKLTEINALIRNIESRLRALQGAHAGNDQDRANHELTVISVLSQKTHQLEQEVSQLLTQDQYQSRATQVVTTTNSDDANGIQIAPLPSPPGGGGGGGGTGLGFPQPGPSASPN